MSDIDNQFSIAGIQFSIFVPRNNFERFLSHIMYLIKQPNIDKSVKFFFVFFVFFFCD